MFGLIRIRITGSWKSSQIKVFLSTFGHSLPYPLKLFAKFVDDNPGINIEEIREFILRKNAVSKPLQKFANFCILVSILLKNTNNIYISVYILCIYRHSHIIFMKLLFAKSQISCVLKGLWTYFQIMLTVWSERLSHGNSPFTYLWSILYIRLF